MKKILSYLWPQTIKTPSEYSGELEITVNNGKKMLDTKNANYSFGSLQRILETGLTKMDFSTVNSVLILGLGGGSVVKSLRDKFEYTKFIKAIELDQKIIEIAAKEFGVTSSNNLQIENNDALEFVKKCTDSFDVIIVDIFIDDQVPVAFYENSFCENVERLLSPKGNLLFNLGFGENNTHKRNDVEAFFNKKKNLQVSLLKNVEGSNDLLLVKK